MKTPFWKMSGLIKTRLVKLKKWPLKRAGIDLLRPLPSEVSTIAHSQTLSSLMALAKELKKEGGVSNNLGWLEEFREHAGQRETVRNLRPVLISLKDAEKNATSLMKQHLSSLVDRLNLYKKQNKDKWRGKGAYKPWFWQKVPRDALWEQIKRHFPYPDFAGLKENELQRMKPEQLSELLKQHGKLERFDGVGSRPVDYGWVKEFDGLNNVAWVIEDLKNAYKKIEKVAF